MTGSFIAEMFITISTDPGLSIANVLVYAMDADAPQQAPRRMLVGLILKRADTTWQL
jgi:hypothetical protein